MQSVAPGGAGAGAGAGDVRARYVSAMRPSLRAAVLAAAASPVLAALPLSASAQVPLRTYADAFEMRFDRSQPVLRYVIHADPPVDSVGYSVEIHIRNAGDTIRVASPIWAPGAYRPANFYRFVKNVSVTTGGARVPVAREDSSTWRAVIRGGEAVVRYDVRYPSAAAAMGMGNYSFLRSDGALFGGPMTYLYLVGATLAPVHVTFDLPRGWRIASGLVPTADPVTFYAPSYDILIDCPVLVGAALHVWPLEVDGIPHRIVWYTKRGAPAIDSTRWIAMHRRIIETSRDIMGRLPYREYTFLYEDGPGGGLEHLNSATMSAPAARLVANPEATAGLTAHEYFHAWNVKRIRPVELGPFAYDREVHTTSLWWAEGITDFFADEILRRSGLLDAAGARRVLAGSIQSYLSNPGHDKLSPQRASWTAWNANTVNGGYNMSYYTTGALIGEMLDMYLRDATGGAKGVDDVERYLFDHYAGALGYTDQNILDAIDTICGCDMNAFYTRYIAGHETFPLADYLRLAGMRLVVTPVRADSAGRPLADVRAGIAPFVGVGTLGSYVGSPARLVLAVPNGSFGRAGLQDGDYITAVNGRPIHTPEDFRAAFGGAKVGDRYTVAYTRAGRAATAHVTILPYETVRVSVEDIPDATPRQLRVRELWLRGPRAGASH